MADLLTPDLGVIGAGAAGLAVAAEAAALGVPVVLIERGTLGGENLNSGGVPSKALIAAARRAHDVEDSERFGVKVARPKVDFMALHDHIVGVMASIAPNHSRERLTGLGVRVIEGSGRFVDPKTVAVGDDIRVQARRFVIATGSTPAIPAIPGLTEASYLTNETVFDLRVGPKHLIVIGAGVVGVEFAQAYARLGAEVTIIDAATPLHSEDPECVAILLDALAREGVRVITGVAIERVQRSRGKIGVALPDGTMIEGSHLLVATGRKPSIEGLGLEAARVRHEPRGILVDGNLKTTNKRVYAIGDVTRAPRFTHLATHHAGRVVGHALFRRSVNADDEAIPRVVFTDPELAHVGLTEGQAKARRHDIRVLRWPFAENDRAQTERRTAGHIKVVTNAEGRILGATIVGHEAGEQIASWSLALAQKLNISAFAALVLPYPTRAEAGKKAAIAYFTPRLTGPWVRRIIAFLRRLG